MTFSLVALMWLAEYREIEGTGLLDYANTIPKKYAMRALLGFYCLLNRLIVLFDRSLIKEFFNFLRDS